MATTHNGDDHVEILTSTQVAQMFGVDPATVRRWADNDLIPSWMTPTGRLRFYASEVTAFRPEPTQARLISTDAEQ